MVILDHSIPLSWGTKKHILRWPKSVTAQTKTSRHKQELHGTNKNSHGTNKNSHGTNKNCHGTNEELHGTNKNSHGTSKNSHGTNENFTAQTKTLTAEVNLTAEMAVYFTRAVTQSLKIWRNR